MKKFLGDERRKYNDGKGTQHGTFSENDYGDKNAKRRKSKKHKQGKFKALRFKRHF